MTLRRRQAFEAITEAATRGEVISLARLARVIGVYDYRKARRIVADLKMMGAI